MRRFAVLVCLGVTLTGCATSDFVVPPLDAADPAHPPQQFAMPDSPLHAAAVARGTRSADGSPGPQYWSQHTRYTLRARLLPEEKRLEGDSRIAYLNRSPHPLDSLYLELSLNLHSRHAPQASAPSPGVMQLKDVRIDGEALAPDATFGPRYVLDGTRLIILPPDPVASNGEVILEISWSVDLPASGAAGRMGHDNDELFFVAYWYPTMSVFDDVEGWFSDPFLGNAEFYHGFGDYDVTIEAPPEWVIHGTGAHVNEEAVFAPEILDRLALARESDVAIRVLKEDDFGRATAGGIGDGEFVSWQFRADRVTDFTFSATRNSLWDAARTPVGDLDGDGATDYALVNAIYRANAPLWQNVVRYSQHALTFLSDYTGVPYPWPHMTAVETSPFETGGMEYPMLTAIGNYNGRGDSALYAVVAHELAHQWVPMIVSPNERRYGWMDEGLTTFAENGAKHQRSPEAMHRLSEMYQYILVARQGDEGEIMTWSGFHSSSSAEVVAVYFKPATLFFALQGVLGESVFMEAYQTFHREWAYKHPYPEDFFATVERVSNRDLGWFWRTWFFETWQLDQAIAEVVQRDGSVFISVENRGDAPMPVRLAIELLDGTILRRMYDAERLWLDGSTSSTFRIPVDEPVIRVEIDPELYFPDIERSNNVWWLRSNPADLAP